jgi:hypothetical protein
VEGQQDDDEQPQYDEQQQVQEEAVEDETSIPEVDTSTMTAKEKRLHELRLKVSKAQFIKYCSTNQCLYASQLRSTHTRSFSETCFEKHSCSCVSL